MPRPKAQFTTAPSVLPSVATAMSAHHGSPPNPNNPASTASDCTGNMVAARKAMANRLAWVGRLVSIGL